MKGKWLIEVAQSWGWMTAGSAKTKSAAIAGARALRKERKSIRAWRVVKVAYNIKERMP